MGPSVIGARRMPLLFFGCLFSFAWTALAPAQTADVVRVEEDWELVVGQPELDSLSPQVTCVLSPVDHVSAVYAALEINNQSLPDFAPGGIQLQVWDGELPLCGNSFPNNNLLATAGETITWTQSVEVKGDMLVFEVTGGSSTTWGSFGGQGYLKASVNSALADLNAYDPAVSVANSGVSYAGNRVQSLVLKCVRLYLSDGQVIEDTTTRVVHSQD